MFYEKDEEKKKEIKAKLATETLPEFAAKFEKSLKDNGGKFFAGDELTYADIWDGCVHSVHCTGRIIKLQKANNSAIIGYRYQFKEIN